MPPRFDPLTDYYGMLGIPSSATPADIQSAYRKLAKTYHPDLHAGSPVAVARMARINFARSLLADPSSRAAYDQARRQRMAGDSAAERVAAATSAWVTARAPATTWAAPSMADTVAGPVVLRPWWDRSTLIMAVLVVPLVLVLGYYIAGSVQMAGRFDHPFLPALALGPRSKPTPETIALEIHGQLAGSAPNLRAARNAEALIENVGEGSPEALLLQTIGVQLMDAANANDQQAWREAVDTLCEVSHTCIPPTPATQGGA